MCAIAGIIGFKESPVKADNKELSKRLIETLKRRGPDDNGVFEDENALLIHTRLAIIDPENGVQPMIFDVGEKKLVIVYNGEIYNTDEVRHELAAYGCKFKTSSDTEVVLQSYAVWGEECPRHLNGIFAFAIWDTKSKRLFAARDRMGVKPFFYAVCGGSLYFSSEIKGLLCCDEISARLDSNGVYEIMLLGPGRQCGSGVLKGIEELKPSQAMVFDEEGLRKSIYYRFDEGADEPFSDDFETVKEKVRFLVTDSIRRQTVSDVPICTFLSGGLDSSIISAVTAKRLAERGERLHTYSVEYKDNQRYFKAGKFQPNSDDEYVKIMADHIGSIHHRVIIDTPELVDALFTATDARDLPGMADVDSSLLLFCAAVRNDFKVALSGECADEIFGGYPWYRDEKIRMSAGFPWSQSTDFRKSLLRDEYLSDGFSPQEYVMSKYRDTISRVTEKSISASEHRMREMMRLNLEWFMQTLLDRKDRMSMYWGLEVRVPFCDHRIVEYLYRCPWEYKNYIGREKGLLREASDGLLPNAVLWRKKSPYPKTHNPSYENAVRSRLLEELSQTNCPVLDILKRDKIEELIKSGRQVQWYGQLMNLPQIMAYILQVNYWMKKYKVILC